MKGSSTRISIRTVADRAGVSAATVSNVLHRKPSVSGEIVERVNAVIAELGFVADGFASRLRSGKHLLAAVLVPDLANPMFATFVSRLEHLARRDGFDLLVLSSNNDPAEEAVRLSNARTWRPAGVIVIPCDGALAARRPTPATWPMVAVDRIPDDPAIDLVAVDNRAAAARMTAHLAQQGYRRCLVVGSSLEITNVRERWDGISAARGGMAAEFLAVGLDADAVAQRVRERLGRNPAADVLFALDHITALEAYQAVMTLGVQVPNQLAFASFDEAQWMRLVSPAISTIRQPVDAMAKAAWTRLVARIGDEQAPIQNLRLDCALEFRGSTLRTTTVPKSAAA